MPAQSESMTDITESFDLIVVGAGLGGLTAAVRGAQHGLRTILIEAGNEVGGTAYFSGGGLHIWGAETWEDYRRHTPLSDERLTRALFDGFRPYVDWLTSTGAPGAYERTVIRGLGLLKYQLGRTMAPHHRRRWFDHLVMRYRAAGGTLWTRTRARSLTHHFIEVERDNQTLTLRGRAIVLAAGGFQAAPDLVERHVGLGPEATVRRAVATDVGDGLRMALAAGAAATPAMDSIYGHLMPAAPCRIDWHDPMAPITLSAFYAQHGIVVNATGRRFVDESAGELNGTTINAAARQPGSLWVVMDDAIRRRPARYEVPRELLRPSSLRYARLLRHARIAWKGHGPALLLDSIGQAERAGALVVRGATVPQLAAGLAGHGVDPVGLMETVADYNAAIVSGTADRLTIPRADARHPIASPPFLAIKVAVGISMTYGGVAIDTSARALDAAGTPVPGLYAVPGTAGGVHHLHYAGALAACGVFGMIAADTAAADLAISG